MPTRPKIKIKDNSDLRNEIDELYEVTEQSVLAKWGIMCAKHVLTLVELDDF